jgi:hypothetical protein
MKDKKNNTAAFSLFGSATATSANGDKSNSESRVTSSTVIDVDVAGLIAKGKILLKDESLDISSGKLKSFKALGKELLKNSPNLAEQFEQATNLSGSFIMIDSANREAGIKENQERSHKTAINAVQRGIDFLEMLPMVTPE